MSRIVPGRDRLRSQAFTSVIVLFICALAAVPNIGAIRGAVFISPNAYKTTQGTITQSCSSYVGGKSGQYRFLITYDYWVGSQKYSSDQVSFGARSSKDKGFIEDYVRKYPIGFHPLVYYKTDEPSFAVLEPTNRGNTRSVFWVILAVSAASTAALIFSLWRLRRPHR